MKTMTISEIQSLDIKRKVDFAFSYVAKGEDGTGLNPETFEVCMNILRNWKMSFTSYMIGREIWGSKKKELHTRETALKLADMVFKKRYSAEVAAFASPTMNTYWTRHIENSGGLEYGELMVDKIGRLEEIETPISWLPSKRYTPAKRQKENMGYFLSHLAKANVSPSKILRNAKACAWNGAITWEMFNHLREIAGDIMVQAVKSKPELEVAL